MQTTPNGPFRTFEDLEVYQVAREFRKRDVCSQPQVARFREVLN